MTCSPSTSLRTRRPGRASRSPRCSWWTASTVISDAAELSGYQVTAEVVGPAKGPKINMIHYRNKTGYKRRQGHRQQYTQVRITGIAKAEKAKARPRLRRRRKDKRQADGTQEGRVVQPQRP